MNLETKKKVAPNSLSGYDLVLYLKELSDEVEWVADGFIAEPSISMLYATDGIGKSLIGVQFSLELCSGLPVFKTLKTTRPYKVIYCMAERSIKEPIKRIKRMISDPTFENSIMFENLVITTEFQGRDLSKEANADALLGILKRHAQSIGGADMLVFDPLYALVKGDLKDDQAINSVFNFFRRASAELGANIFFFHHENRGTRQQGETERTGQDYYGNKFISGLCTAVWHMVKDPQDQFKTIIVNEKDTESALIPRFTLQYDPEYSTVHASVTSCQKSKTILINAFLKKYKDSAELFEAETLFKESGINTHPASGRKIIADLIKSGKIRNMSESGKKGHYLAL